MTDSLTHSQRLQKVRLLLKKKSYDGFILPYSDEFQNEQLPIYNERLQWLTNFSGSAGIAVVLSEKAAVFSDGRYTEQLAQQVHNQDYETLPIESFFDWLKENCPQSGVLSYDPWLHSVAEIIEWKKKFPSFVWTEYQGTQTNPIDECWLGRTKPKVEIRDHLHSGQSRLAKIQALDKVLTTECAEAIVLLHPPSIAWLLNLRSNEVPYAGFPLLRLAYIKNKLFIVTESADQLTDLLQELNPCFLLPNQWTILAKELSKKQALIDFRTLPQGLKTIFDREYVVLKDFKDPCLLWKACKNDSEIQGFKDAHHRDGRAMVQFLCWFEQQNWGTLTEQDCIDQLFAFRQQAENFQCLSFPTIAGAGPNGAIIHYRCTPQTNRILQPTDLFLVDSGSHYKDGTTDITRTVLVQTATATQKNHYTRVLKGHIALAKIQFPAVSQGKGGVCGLHLDVLARQALWDIGLDYAHGTGHGVGQYLNVHEGPQGISRGSAMIPLQVGMVLSNEPGYYKTGHYGIRLENLMVVKISENYPDFLCFEPLTLVPFDNRLIDISLLNTEEKQWLNAYHSHVYIELSPVLAILEQEWLKKATLPL